MDSKTCRKLSYEREVESALQMPATQSHYTLNHIDHEGLILLEKSGC